MGKATVVNYVDDMTGKPIERTEAKEAQIIVDGWLYTIDLGAASLAKYITPLTEKATTRRRFSAASSNVVPMVAKRAANGGAPVFSQSVAEKEQRQAARAWWLRNAARHELLPSYSERGRIPQVVTNLYNENSGRDFAPPALPEALRAKPVKATPAPKPVAAPAFSEAEPESKPLTPAARRSAVAASKSGRKATAVKAPAKAATPTAARARSRTAKA